MPAAPAAAPVSAPAATPVSEAAPTTPIAVVPAVAGVTTSQMRSAWTKILEAVQKKSKSAYMVAYNLDVMALEGDVLTLRFASNYDLENFKSSAGAPDVLRKAIEAEFGIVVKFKPHMEAAKQPQAAAPVNRAPEPVVVAAPAAEPAEPEDPEEPTETPKSRNAAVDESARYGESLLREILGAEPIDE